MNKQYKCLKCKKTIDIFERFSDGLCVDCHSEVMDKIPLEKIDKPDFIKTVRI